MLANLWIYQLINLLICCIFVCSVRVRVCMHVCLCECVCMCVCMCGGLGSKLSIFLICSPFCLLGQGLSVNLELANLTNLASQLAQRNLLFLPCNHWDYRQATRHAPLFCVHTGDPNSSPHTFTASTLPTEPSAQSEMLFIYLLSWVLGLEPV